MAASSQSKASPLASLDNMGVPELTALIEAAERKRREKLESAKQELVDEFRARAAELGLSMDALLPQRQHRPESAPASPSSRKQRSDAGVTRPAKYRGPNGEEWSGRGRTPRWMSVLEAEGRGREDFAIQ